MSEIAYANQEEMFAVAESVSGQLQKPTSSARMYTTAPVDFGQEQESLEDEQIRATASRLSPIIGRMMPGEFSFETYVKPSGVVGTAPEHDALFVALMGAGGVSGQTYEYTLANEVPSVSIWIKKGHTVFCVRGATIETVGFTVAGNDVGRISWSGKYMRQLVTGTAYTASIAAAVLTMGDAGCESFSVGGFVNVGTDTNGAAGFEILAIEHTTKKITLEASPAVSGVQLVTPWLPIVGAVADEKPVHGKLGKVTVDTKEAIVLSANVNMVNNIKYYIDEKNDLLTAERYGRPKVREIEGTLSLYFLRRGAGYYYRSENQISNALIIPVGKVAGKIMELHIPYAEYKTPKISGEEEFQEDIPFIAVASSALNDEFKIVFR